jgi:ribonuclease E
VTAPAGVAAPSRAWASLPAIQRTTGDMPLVAAPRSFVGELPGTTALPPIVQPLGHEVSALATPGLVVARTRATPAAPARSLPAPVQRRAVRSNSRSAPAVAPLAAAAPAPEIVEHAHEAPPPAPVVAPVRSMPTISRSAVRVPDRPLTSAAAAARPARLQRSAAPASAASGAAPAAPLLPATGGGMRRSRAPIATPTVSRQAAAPAPAASAPALPTLPTGPTRAGLGEPMTSLPASARPVTSPGPVIARQPIAGRMPLAASNLRRPVQRDASEDDELSITSVSPAAAPMVAQRSASSPGPSLPHLPVVGSAARTSSNETSGPLPAATSAAPSVPEIRPIAAANPIRTSLDLQRDAADDLDDGPDDSLPIPWWGSAGGSTPAGLPALAASAGPSTAVQRSPVAGFSAAAAPSGARSVAPPASSTMGSGHVQRIAAAGSGASLPALTMPPAVVARSAAPAAGPVAAPAAQSRSIVAGPVVQTLPAGPTPPVAGPFHGLGSPGATVQRDGTVAIAPQQPGAEAPGGAGIGPAGPVGAGGPSGPTSTGGRSERDLDELAQALFGRIRTRLRSDLIHDREAKGLTFDNV